MNRNEFNGFISGINLPGPGDLDELRELTSLFPWFHSAHMLFLRGLKENNDIRFDSQLRVSALSVADREVLYYYLFLDPADAADASGEGDVAKPAFAESPGDGVTPVVIPATGVTPVFMEVQITDDVPVPDEAPVTEEVPVPEEASGADDVLVTDEVSVTEEVLVTDEIPVTDDLPVPDEVSGAEEVPVSEETIGADEIPGAEEVPVAEEISVPDEAPVTDEAPVIDDIHVPDEVSGADEIPVTEEVSVPDEASGTAEAPVTEEVLVTDEIFVASDKIAGNVIDGAEEQPSEEQTERPRTREDLIAEIEARLRELEEIHRAAADRVAQQAQEQQIPIIAQMPEAPPVTEPESPVEIECQPAAPAESEAEAKPWQEELLELIPDEPVLEYEPAAQPVPDELVLEYEPAAEPVPDEPVVETESATQLTPDEPPEEAEPAAQLTPDGPPEEAEPAAQLTPADLIDRFIRTSPSIERLSPDDLQPVKDLSAESTEEHGKFITETLAKIYINQGYYSRAINIYEKLSIQYPEKSVYFASRIEKIKDLIK
ncbi:MAG: hypothetical protein WBL00_04100 [Bacteroidales bacterium]